MTKVSTRSWWRKLFGILPETIISTRILPSLPCCFCCGGSPQLIHDSKVYYRNDFYHIPVPACKQCIAKLRKQEYVLRGIFATSLIILVMNGESREWVNPIILLTALAILNIVSIIFFLKTRPMVVKKFYDNNFASVYFRDDKVQANFHKLLVHSKNIQPQLWESSPKPGGKEKVKRQYRKFLDSYNLLQQQHGKKGMVLLALVFLLVTIGTLWLGVKLLYPLLFNHIKQFLLTPKLLGAFQGVPWLLMIIILPIALVVTITLDLLVVIFYITPMAIFSVVVLCVVVGTLIDIISSNATKPPS